VHASTRLLLLLVTTVAIIGGWWFLFAANDTIPAIAYGVLWTAVVLVAARVLLAVGFGYNRLTTRRGQGSLPKSQGPVPKPADALAELTDLRDRQLISADEYEAQRAKILERL
jgi:hypothetical protein